MFQVLGPSVDYERENGQYAPARYRRLFAFFK